MNRNKRKSIHLRDDSGPSESQPKKPKADVGKAYGEPYKAAGLKSTLHGNIYQLKLLMLFMWRGIQEKYNFALATEMVSAEKFDDVVFRYEDKLTGNKIFRFLQAKHRQDETKKITLHDLETENDDDFSLQKYFISYLKIKRNPEFHGYKLKDFVICCNIDLDDELKSSFQPVKSEDDILTYSSLNEECRRLKFKNSFPQKERIFSILRERSERFILAKKLVSCIISNKQRLELRDDIFKSYHHVLGDEILERKKKDGKKICVFKDSFINGSNLPLEVEEFRKAFHKAYSDALQQQKRKKDSQLMSEPDFIEKMKTIELNSSSTFGKKSNDQSSLKTSLPIEDDISDDEINCFLNDLVLAVNQPNEIELGDIIEAEMMEGENINLIAEFMVIQLREYMLDWMKEKEGRFLTHEDGEVFFQKIVQKISELVMIGQTTEYCEKVENYGVEFSKKLEELDNFLKFRDKRIFNLITHQANTTLSSIKVYQSVKKSRTYTRNDFMFIKLDSLLMKRITNYVIAASKSITSHHLLVIECEMMKENNIQKPYYQLCFIINLYEKMKKQVILVTQENDHLAKQIRNTYCRRTDIYEEKEEEKISLIDLTADSQKQLLENGKVKFQGEVTYLDKLIDKRSKNLAKYVNEELIHKLINKEIIKISESPTDGKYEEAKKYYIDRTLYRHEIKIASDFKEHESTFLIIENHEVPVQISHSDIIIISDTDDDFKNVCKTHKKSDINIHWLTRMDNNKFTWKQSNANDLSKLLDFVETKDQSVKFLYTPKKISDITDRVVIIASDSGMGKSVKLSHLAVNTTSVSKPVWIMRSNVKDYLTMFNKWQTKGSIVGINEAMQFLYEAAKFQIFENFETLEEKETVIKDLLIVKNDKVTFNFLAKGGGTSKDEVILKNGERKKCKKSSSLKIEGSSMLEIELFTYFYNCGRVYLLFDGFDEISPTYDNTVIELIQAIKQTKVDKIWICSRPYNDIQNEIEKKLGTFSYSLKPFIEAEQKQFLKRFWKRSLELDELNENRAEIFISNLLSKFSTSTSSQKGKSVPIAAIPLFTYMIGEVFTTAFKRFYSPENSNIADENTQFLDKNLDLVELYEKFLVKKFDIANHELAHNKYNVPTVNDDDYGETNEYEKKLKNFRDRHEMLAVDSLMEKLLPKKEMENMKKFKLAIEEGREKTGIINKIIGGKPDFIHNSFSEYLAANYLWGKNYKPIPINEFKKDFIQKIMIKRLIKGNMVKITDFFQQIAIRYLRSKDDKSGEMGKLKILLLKLAESVKYEKRKKYLPKYSQVTTLLLGIFEFGLPDTDIDLLIEIITDDIHQYSLFYICIKHNYTQLANAIGKNLKTEVLKSRLQTTSWRNTLIWEEAESEKCELGNKNILKEKYSVGVSSWKDNENKILIESIFDSELGVHYQVLKSCLQYNVLDGNPYLNDENEQKLPISQAVKYNAPPDVMKLLIQRSNFDIVNKFQDTVKTADIHFMSFDFINNYDANIIELALEKGMDFSRAIPLLLFEISHLSLNGCISEYINITVHNTHLDFPKYYPKIRDSVHQPLDNIHLFFERIELLLKNGTWFNCRDIKYRLTAFEIANQIHTIHLLLNEVHKLYENNNDESNNPLDLILRFIIDSISKHPNFKGYNIILESEQISVSPNYDQDLLEYNEKIDLLPNYIAELILKCHEENNTSIIGSNLKKLATDVEYIKQRMKTYPFTSQEQKEYGQYDLSKSFIMKYLWRLNEHSLDLLDRILELYYRQDYTVDDALAEVTHEASKYEKILTAMNGNSEEKLYNLDEILHILDIERVSTNIPQKSASTFYECGGIQLLINIWSNLNNYIGRRKIMDVLGHTITFSDQSSEIFKLFNKLNNSHNDLINAIENQNYLGVNKIVQQNSNFIKSIINSPDDKFGSPLHYATYKGDSKIVKCLLAHGANPNIRLLENCELLLHSTKSKKSSGENADDELNCEGWTPIMLADRYGHIAVKQSLLSRGAEADAEVYRKTSLEINELLEFENSLSQRESNQHESLNKYIIVDLKIMKSVLSKRSGRLKSYDIPTAEWEERKISGLPRITEPRLKIQREYQD